MYFPLYILCSKRKYPTLIVHIFLVSARTHSISRYIHIQTLCVHKRNVLRFLQHGTYHVVVRGGSHFCQSPKGGASGVFLLKRKGGPTLFWEKNTKIPQPSPPPKKKRTFPKNIPHCAYTGNLLLINRLKYIYLLHSQSKLHDHLANYHVTVPH